jgi:hypothetical protein
VRRNEKEEFVATLVLKADVVVPDVNAGSGNTRDTPSADIRCPPGGEYHEFVSEKQPRLDYKYYLQRI